MSYCRFVLRVWMISRNLPTGEDPVAGRFVVDQARALDKAVDLELLHLRSLSLRRRAGPRSLPPARTISYVLLPKGVGRDLSVAGRLLLRMVRRGRPSLLHAHWSTGLGGLVLAARIARVPIVFTEHGGPFPARSPRVADARRVLNRANVVICVSEWLREQLADQGVTAPLVVVPNIVDPVFAPTPIPDNGRCRIAAIARLDGFDKGIPEIIEAVAHLRQDGLVLHLTVVGDGQDRARLERLASSAPGQIRFAGTLGRDQIAEVLASSHALVSGTKDYETFGVAIAEAIAAGRPVVATRVGAVPELVKPGVNGILVEYADPILIADAIRQAMSNHWDPISVSISVEHCTPVRVRDRLTEIYKRTSIDR